MDSIPQDTLLIVCEHLTDIDKINLSAVSAHFERLKYNVKYTTKRDIAEIEHLSFFDNFERVYILKSKPLPKYVKEMHFRTNGQIQTPDCVTHLIISSYSGRSIRKYVPPTVKYLEIRHRQNDALINLDLPDSVTHLIIDQLIDTATMNCTFKSVTHLTFGVFNGWNNHMYFPNVTHLTFCDTFNEHVYRDMFPKVTHMTFGMLFRKSIKDAIPLTVTHLTFGTFFNEPIDDAIPDGVTHLTFGDYFTRPIEGNIPASVTHLTFGEKFSEPIEGAIPKSVTHLVLHNSVIKNVQLPFLTHLTWDPIGDIEDDVPISVTHLTLGPNFDLKMLRRIPSSVTNLTLDGNKKPIKIPSSITHLTFGDNFNQIIENIIPSSVTHLTFGFHFNKPIANTIPSSVTHLTFGYHFNHLIANNIPSSVIHIKFGNQFEQSLDTLPLSIKEITLYRTHTKLINNNLMSKIRFV